MAFAGSCAGQGEHCGGGVEPGLRPNCGLSCLVSGRGDAGGGGRFRGVLTGTAMGEVFGQQPQGLERQSACSSMGG
jgi:hypothetical protein